MIEYIKYFFNPDHLFSVRPPVMSGRAAIILAVIFIALIVAGIVANMYANKTKDGLKAKGYKKFFHLGLTIGILGFVYLFFAVQGIALLSSRFILIILATIAVVWGSFIEKYLIKDVPKKREKINEKRNFEKYIP